jgi:myosin heavy subunit
MVDDKDGENGISEVLKALAAVQEDDSYAQSVYDTLAAILWLGNVQFEGDEAKVTDPAPLEACAKLFGCTTADLEKALTHESKEIAGEKIHTPLPAAAAENSRDALARNMYGRVFDDLVQNVNTCLGGGSADSAIGVLDIFGFESFQKNSFEQFCINFTNEKLQATFNQHIFNDELRLYEEEQIQWLGIVCPNNDDALTVIAGKGTGVFDVLDATCRLPRATDDKLADMLHQEWDTKKNQAFPRTNPREARNHFIIKHYAGPVTYCTDGWLDKNKDTISADITDLCRNNCEADLVKSLWASGRFGTFTTTTASGQKVRKKFQGLGKAFMKSINKLTEKIDSTKVHFIRAIKTNAPMKPGFYQPDYVIMQLRDQGLLSLCDLLKAGYPTRIGYGELQERFAPKMPKAIMDIGLSPKDFTNALVWAYGLPKANYQVGLTKIFFRAGKVAMLDELDNITPEQHEQLTARVKRWVIRRKWRMGVAKAVAFKKAGDLFRSVHAMHMWYKAADLMLVYIRTLRRNYFKIKGKVAARTIARTCRMWPVRKDYLKKTVETRKKKAAIVLQAACRAHLERKNYEEAQAKKKEDAAALLLQRLCRMIVTKKETEELFGAKREASAARALQSLIRASAERKKFLITRAEGKASAEKVQRLFRLISGETGVKFKAIVNQMGGAKDEFTKQMDALVAKYTGDKPLGQKKLFTGGGGGGGFEMWISIKLVDPSASETDLQATEFSDGKLKEDVFAGNWMKMKRVEGLLGEFFSDPSNASSKDQDGNYVWHRDPNQFKYIMDFIRDGQVSWPTAVDDAEALLSEVDYFGIGSMVLPLVEELRQIKFGGGAASGGESGAGVLGGDAGSTSVASAGPCDNYRLDMAAATFGLCKCGCVNLGRLPR